MGLFGNSYRRQSANTQPTIDLTEQMRRAQTNPDKQMTATQPMQGQRGRNNDGMWGSLSRPFTAKNLPRTIQLLGAGLQGNGALQHMLDNEAEAERLRVEQYAANRQRAQLDELIAGLPPEQQRLARLDPQGFVRSLMRQQAQGQEWENNGTTPYRIGPDGSVIMGSGAIPHRPRATAAPRTANGAPELPSGFDWE